MQQGSVKPATALPESSFSPVHEVQGLWPVNNRSCTFVVPGMSAIPSQPAPSAAPEAATATPSTEDAGEAVAAASGSGEADVASQVEVDAPASGSGNVPPHGGVSGAIMAVGGAVLGGADVVVSTALSTANSVVDAVLGVHPGAGSGGNTVGNVNARRFEDTPEPSMPYLLISHRAATLAAYVVSCCSWRVYIHPSCQLTGHCACGGWRLEQTHMA